MSQNPVHARKRARRTAMQAIYQWQVGQQNLSDIEQQFMEEHAQTKMDRDYFSELLRGVAVQAGELDEALGPFLSRQQEEVTPVELAILRLASFELKNRMEVPYRVVINEAVDLAKKFGADQSHKFVNGVLDKLARQYRSVEISAARKA